MKLNTLDDLFLEELRILYDAEFQLIRALPLFAQAAGNAELKTLFRTHLEQTHVHIARLDRIFEDFEESTRGRRCHALVGLIAEADEWIQHEANPALRDAGLIGKVQRIEHYEIAAYTCARTYARLLGHNDAEEVLQSTLHEEAVANVLLTELGHHVTGEASSLEQHDAS